jgi:hypothetical protein
MRLHLFGAKTAGGMNLAGVCFVVVAITTQMLKTSRGSHFVCAGPTNVRWPDASPQKCCPLLFSVSANKHPKNTTNVRCFDWSEQAATRL